MGSTGGFSMRETSAPQRRRYDRLRLLHDPRQVVFPAETLGVDLVDVLASGSPPRDPPPLRDHLEPADLRAVPGPLGEPAADGLAAERLRRHLLGRELL